MIIPPNFNRINVHKLHVGNKVYEDPTVPDGFYDSISSLKTLDQLKLSSSSHFQSAKDDYRNILKICSSGCPVPPISLQKTHEILKKLRPSVSDLYSITAYHYLHGGDSALEHLHLLLNGLIADINNLTVDELNTVWACILFKGHGKDRSVDRSYRTISTCPFVSKVLDTYIADLYSSTWNADTCTTQFQKRSSSHDLAALLLTETINHSMTFLSKPVYALYLDAMSAFDLLLHELLIGKLFSTGIHDQGLTMIATRLTNRKTVCEWKKILMGPITDECGVEQGGISSSDYYKVYNNQQLQEAQESLLGVPIGPVTISSIGQADDVVLLSNDIYALQALLDLSLSYCRKNHVTLCSEKTKLQVYSTKSTEMEAFYSKIISPITMDGKQLNFVSETEHVGVVRSNHGNLPHILERFTAH